MEHSKKEPGRERLTREKEIAEREGEKLERERERERETDCRSFLEYQIL